MKRSREQSNPAENAAKSAKIEEISIPVLNNEGHRFKDTKYVVIKSFDQSQLGMYKEMGKQATDLRLDRGVKEEEMPLIMPCFPKVTSLALNMTIKRKESAEHFNQPLVKLEDGWKSNLDSEFMKELFKKLNPTLRILHCIRYECIYGSYLTNLEEFAFNKIDGTHNGDTLALLEENASTLERLILTDELGDGECPGCMPPKKHTIDKDVDKGDDDLDYWGARIDDTWEHISALQNLKYLRVTPTEVFVKLSSRDKRLQTVFFPKLEEAVLSGYVKREFLKCLPVTLKKLTLEGRTNKLTPKMLERFPNLENK